MATATPGVLAVHRSDPSPAADPGDKVHLLERWLSKQERITAFILHQVFQIKNDMVSHCQETTGFQHTVNAAWQLLENYMQTVTGIVEKLSQDIQVLERQIRTRDGATVQTNFAVRSLDHMYIQSLGDLHRRVVRYSKDRKKLDAYITWRSEASIAQLSGDIRVIRHEVQKIVKEIYSLCSTLKYCVRSLEKMVMQLLGKMETSNSDQNSNSKTVQGDQHHELQLPDFKLTSIPNDFKDQIQNQWKWMEAQLMQYEELIQLQLLSAVKERLEVAEKNTEEKLLLLSSQLEQSGNPEKHRRQLNKMKSDEKTCLQESPGLKDRFGRSLRKSRMNTDQAFNPFTLELLKQTQNTKLKLE